MTKKDGSGEIITFYSYKGGTGRSMALANVACLLAAQQTQGKGVLMIDWDLEAPGLHRFFQGRFSEVVAESKNIGRPFDELPGLIDLFLTFDQQTPDGPPETDEEATERAGRCLQSVQLEHHVVPTSIPYLSLMKAGCFDPEYSARVNTFDWESMFNRSPLLIQLLAERLADVYRYVLIDSRTGLTDISGICTTLMPEKLVVVFTPNRQSLTGVIDQVRRATRYRRQSDDLRPLLVFPLPSRIDISEPRRRDAWRFGDLRAGIEGYQPLFEKLFREVYDLSHCDLSGYFDEIQVPHVPAYAYGEEIGALIERTGDALSITRSYRSLCERAINGANPWTETPQAASAAKIAEAKAQAAESSRVAEAQALVASKAKRIARISVLATWLLSLLFSGVGSWIWKEGVTVQYATSIVLARLHLVSVAEPKMVSVSGGPYQQGDLHGLESQDEQPVRPVTIKPFAIGKYEVTFQEYDRYLELTGGRLPSDQSWGRDKRPVINVSWDDAVAYAKWLSQATGKYYRLPTESEWEYAARSGGKDEVWAGTSDESDLKNYAVFRTDRTEPVGEPRKANGFGLYDMSGNVWEWTDDCWHENYRGAPTDGSAWLEENGGDCGLRVLRGGSWYNGPGSLRASDRYSFTTGYRSYTLGFRLAQDIP